MKKPRVRFCWYCSRKLWGNKYTEDKIDGYSRIFHKSCHETFKRLEAMGMDADVEMFGNEPSDYGLEDLGCK